MAITPAAKDPNSFASSNLSGGNSATGAILGIPQDPNTPRGPQPTALPQGMPGGVPNYFASASGGQAPQPQVPQVPGGDQFDQVHAQNQQVISQMFGGQNSQQEPVYGLGPNGELQVGNQVAPMQDNPTAAAQLLQSPQAQGPTQLRPGFTPVRASEINQYLQGISHGAMSDLYQGGKELLTRTPGALLNSAGKAATWAGLDNVGTALGHAGEGWDYATGADQPVDTLGRGPVGKWFVNSAADAAQMVPFIAQSFLMPETTVPKALSVLGDVALNFGLFGSQAAQEKKESLIAQGVSPEEANKAGWVDFFSTGGGMMAMGHASHAALQGTYGGAQQIVSKLKAAVGSGAMTAEEAAAAVTNPALLARTAANLSGNIAAQGAGMAGMSAASAASNNAYGGEHQDVGDAALHGLGAGLSLGVLTSPLGVMHQMHDSARRADLGRSLNTPTEQVDLLNAVKQQKTAESMVPEVGALAGKPEAQAWAKGVGEKAFNAADGNQFAADTRAQQEAQAQYDAAQTPAQVPPTTEQQAQGKADKAAAKAQREQHELNATNALIDMGIAQPKGKDVKTVADALEAGVDVTSPGALPFREALLAKKYALAKSELEKLKKGQNDSTLGQARTGDADVGGPGGSEPPGGMGTRSVKPAEPGKRVGAGTEPPAASVQPPVPGGDTGVRPAAVDPLEGLPKNSQRAPRPEDAPHANPKIVHPEAGKGEIPDFSLEPTDGSPSPAWQAAHPEEPMGPPDLTTSPKQRSLPGMGPKLVGKNEGARIPKRVVNPEGDTAAYVAPEQKPGITAEQAYNRLKRSGHPEYSRLTPDEQRAVEAAHAEGRVTQAEWDKAMKQAIRQQREERVSAAKQNRKRVEADQAEEAAMTDEEREARQKKERAEDTSVSPEEHFIEAFGASGPAAYAAAHGDTWEQIAAAENAQKKRKAETSPRLTYKPISADAVRKRVARIDPADIDAADLTPKEKDKLRRSLDFAQGDVVEKRDRAAQSSGTADTEIGSTSPESQSMERELLVTPGVSVQRAGRTGIMARPENEAGRGEGLSTKERTLAEQSKAIEEELQAALEAKDYKKAFEIRERQKELAAEFAKDKEDPLKDPDKDERKTTEARITEVNDLINDAEEAGDHKKVKALERERQQLYDLRDAEMEKAERAQAEDVNENDAGNSDDFKYGDNDYLDPGKKGESLAAQGYEKAEVPRVQAGTELTKLLDKLHAGEMTDGEFLLRARMLANRLVEATQVKAANRMLGERVRGADRALEVLLGARRKGELDPDMVNFAKWLLDNNPHLAEGLAISLKTPGEDTPAGRYNPFSRVATLFKTSGNVGTGVHEILHHAERMMPPEVQKGIQKAWADALAKALKNATPEQQAALKEMLLGMAGGAEAHKKIAQAFKDGTLDYDKHYQLVNPSEYWAVNGTRILEARHAANTWMAKAAQWMREFVQHAKNAFGLSSDGAVLKALDSITKGTGEFQSKRMLSEGRSFNDIQRNISKLPEKYQEPVRGITDTLSRWANSGLDKAVFTKDLVERGVKRGMDALSHYQELLEGRNTRAGHFEKMAYNAIEDVRVFSDKEKRDLSDFIQHSNLSGEWGYGDKATGKAKKLFEETLSPRAQKVAKAIFDHGDTMLKQKKESIQTLASSLYDSMLEGATGKAREDILAEKAGFLKKYNSLMKIDEGTPYSSLQRQGDFVAVGKSEAYLKAEEAAYAKGSTRAERQALMDMQSDPNHYLVSAAHDEAEAKVLRQNMRDAGFPTSDDHTYYRPKDTWSKDLMGGNGVIAGMSKLRNQLDTMSSEAASPQDRLRYASMSRLLANMWLDALSQNSARKSEMRRLGVHGTMDTIDSFRTAAKADAHFIAGIEFNDKMLSSLKQAAKQADKGSGEERTTKLNIMKEFMARHEQGVTNPPTPWANKITKATALWQIATSPAHYVGNLMQPWTMTLPTLAAKHGYGEATGEFFKAYKEIGDILTKTGLLSSLKIEDMPADVRQPMKRLLELGRLDIGMNTEYGSMSLRPRNVGTKALQAASDRITAASLKMESLNRLASAAAAYRLELKRNGGDAEKALHYAGDIVADTHGDHSRANAPRIFNNGFGKVALQFRKFQLVQLTQMAKMIGGADFLRIAKGEKISDEQKLALRTLAYTMAHVAALGGAVGMPGFSTFSWAASQMQHALTGVAGEDWETQIAKAAGDEHVANLLLRGLPGLLGVDLTSKVGYGDMLGIAPYVDVDVTDRQSVQDAIGQITAGPFGGLVGRAAQSLHHAMVGNYYKALEGMMPQGVSNIMKGAREIGAVPGIEAGVTNTKGDKLTNINAGEAMLEALGFAPASKSLMQAETGAMIKSSEDFKSRLELLKERYTNTVRSGGDVSNDVKNMNDLRTQMMERGFKPTPLGDLLKSPTQQLIRQIFTTPGGLQYKPGKDQRAVEQFPQ